MGWVDDKNNLVQQINLSEVLGDLPNNKLISNIASVKSTSFNLVPFLLDLMSIACKDTSNGAKGCLPSVGKGANPSSPRGVKCDVLRVITEILVDFFPVLIRIVKEGIIKGIKAGLLCPADFKIPSLSLSTSVELKPDEFDSGKLTTLDPTVFPASLFFGEPDKDLNVFLANLIQSGVGSTGNWKNLLNFEVIDYAVTSGGISTTDLGLLVKIDNSFVGKEFDVFLKDYMNSIELFNFDNFIPNLMEEVNGSISNILNNSDINYDFSIDKATDKEKVGKMVEKILDTDPCEEDFSLSNNFFTFNSDELLDIEAKAKNRLNGQKIFNYSCTPSVTSNLEKDLKIFNNSKELIKEKPSEVKSIIKSNTNRMLDDMANRIGFGEIENIKKSISIDLALALPKLSTSLIFTPKIMVLFQVAKKLVTNQTYPEPNTVNLNSVNFTFDFAVANRVFFEYVVRESGAALLEILYNQVKEEILKIVACIVAVLIKEAVNKKIQILKSLTGGFNKVSGLIPIKENNISQFL
jgi:hypothetical protein